MMKNKNFLIFEIVTSVILVGLILCILFVDIDLGIFKIVSQKTIRSQYSDIKDLDTKLSSAKINYDNGIQSVETSKTEFKRQKDEYDAISDETISIIKEATTDEKYNIEYMWVKIGNYAKSNNLTLSLVEPGGTAQTTTDTSKTTTTQTTSSTTTQPTGTTGTAATTGTNTASQSATSSGNEFTIKVKGNYTDVSDFIFELENDDELRFKLDKIKMEYAGSNQISATFSVKNLVFKK